MLKNSSKILFLLIVMLGTLITISSNSWLAAWMGLEINLLAFIPLMSNTNNLMSSESSLKYFLTQALASLILLLAIILYMMKIQINNDMSSLPEMMMFSSLLMKSGSAPFHFWFPSVMEGLSWTNALLLMTWQKIAPLMMMSYLNIKSLMIMTIVMSVMVGSLGGLNQTSLRKLMAFSSINHLGWMITAMYFSESMWLIYFSIYTILSINIIMFFNMFKMLHMNQLFSNFFNSKSLKFILFTNLLSLGGLPPFLGFLPKWMVIQSLTINNQLMLMIMITTLTLVTLFFYIRLCFSAFMLNYYEPNWTNTIKFNTHQMIMYLIMSFTSSGMLFLISIMYFML
uniref:NADH-ubiquinone oxidoreductase chain 2 n=1 Tax=Dasypogon diadema TaxID=468822 RepID=A0A5S9BFV2_9MUSC|nr:NADH dehydrogenase subunit 2 [Dasypogon diadema]AYW52654.1 NADH dehydrogenase subunit 2 [Dasypogon diadema]